MYSNYWKGRLRIQNNYIGIAFSLYCSIKLDLLCVLSFSNKHKWVRSQLLKDSQSSWKQTFLNFLKPRYLWQICDMCPGLSTTFGSLSCEVLKILAPSLQDERWREGFWVCTWPRGFSGTTYMLKVNTCLSAALLLQSQNARWLAGFWPWKSNKCISVLCKSIR